MKLVTVMSLPVRDRIFNNLFKAVPTRYELEASYASSCKAVPQVIVPVKELGLCVHQPSNPTLIMEKGRVTALTNPLSFLVET